MWLFDTVALSETVKRQINPGFGAWLSEVDDADVHTSVLCLGELRRGAVMLTEGSKRDAIERWLERDLPGRLGPRILPIEHGVAQLWGRLGARGKSEPIDALIGASALAAKLTVVTRNVRHFDGLGVAVLNPWT